MLHPKNKNKNKNKEMANLKSERESGGYGTTEQETLGIEISGHCLANQSTQTKNWKTKRKKKKEKEKNHRKCILAK